MNEDKPSYSRRESNLTPLIGDEFAARLEPTRRAIRISLALAPVCILIAVGMALTSVPWRLAAVVPLALVPFVALIIENLVLYRRGREISRTLTDAGLVVHEPLFARSRRDVEMWAGRNRVDLARVRVIANAAAENL